jgi:hypothetical protein
MSFTARYFFIQSGWFLRACWTLDSEYCSASKVAASVVLVLPQHFALVMYQNFLVQISKCSGANTRICDLVIAEAEIHEKLNLNSEPQMLKIHSALWSCSESHTGFHPLPLR